MATEQVFDPSLGEPRDAFPGEVVPPEQEKTLQRLMRKEKERFTNDLGEVKRTGKLSASDEEAVLRFADLRAEVQRAKYLEASNSNPANILQNALKELFRGKDDIVKESLISLDENIARLQKNIFIERSSDKMSDKSLNTERNVRSYLSKAEGANTLIRGEIANVDETGIAFELIKKLGLIPLESLSSFSDLYQAVKAANNPQASGKPSLVDYAIRNLPSNSPGLEGITASIYFTGDTVPNFRGFTISVTPQALARIVDKGQYVPYQSKT